VAATRHPGAMRVFVALIKTIVAWASVVYKPSCDMETSCRTCCAWLARQWQSGSVFYFVNLWQLLDQAQLFGSRAICWIWTTAEADQHKTGYTWDNKRHKRRLDNRPILIEFLRGRQENVKQRLQIIQLLVVNLLHISMRVLPTCTHSQV